MQQRSALPIELAADQFRQVCRSPGGSHKDGKAKLARSAGGCLTHGKQRTLARFVKLAASGECAQRVAARDDERLHAGKIERRVRDKLDLEHRREHRLISSRGELLGLAARIRLWPRDKQAHQASFARNSGPARATSSSPASAPSLVACSAGPVTSMP